MKEKEERGKGTEKGGRRREGGEKLRGEKEKVKIGKGERGGLPKHVQGGLDGLKGNSHCSVGCSIGQRISHSSTKHRAYNM